MNESEVRQSSRYVANMQDFNAYCVELLSSIVESTPTMDALDEGLDMIRSEFPQFNEECLGVKQRLTMAFTQLRAAALEVGQMKRLVY